jgi:DNA polymerase-1
MTLKTTNTEEELLGRWGTLDEVLAHAGEVTGAKRRENLLACGDKARLSRELCRLDAHVPLELDWRQARAGQYDAAALVALFDELRFRTFATKVRTMGKQAGGTEPVPAASQAEASGGHDPAAIASAAPAVDYRTVATPEALACLVEEMSRQPRISLDTETTHIWPTWASLVGLSFSWADCAGYYVPVRAPAGEPQLDERTVLEALRPVLENPAIEKVGQNLKYDLIVLREAGVAVAGVAFDTMVASYLLEAGARNHNLDELALRYLGHTTTKITELIGTGSQQKRMDEVPVPQVTHYAAEDADVAWRLTGVLGPKLKAAELDGLFQKLEMPLIDVLVEMERNGIRVDTARLAELSGQYAAAMQRIERDIYDLAGHEFNIASPKQLQQVLFEEQKLPVGKRNKTGPSTDQDVLEELARRHPLPAKIIEYRQYAKLRNTYVDALPAMVHPRTGRVHASFNQVVAATGRLSCNDPNLQNIPVRNERGREIRSAFLPGVAGWSLLAADYSQIELRVLAHFSGDATLRAAFERDEDIHTLVASQVHGVPPDAVTAEMRRAAKAVNFGIIYGQSPFGLAAQLDIEQEEAAQFIEAYFARYPGVDEFLVKTLADCRESGYVKTILGRRRAVSGVRPGAARGRNLPERTAINTVIQGSAADLIKLAMVAVLARLRRERRAARMLLQVHDELILEVPPEELGVVAGLVSAEMSGVLPLAVPLRVDVSVGRNWADLVPYPIS